AAGRALAGRGCLLGGVRCVLTPANPLSSELIFQQAPQSTFYASNNIRHTKGWRHVPRQRLK
ncbi:hypothetical protein K5549_017568, partial [Capra hircus]